MLHTTLMTFITSLKEEISHVVKKCWSSSDNSSICRFVTKQSLRGHATYHRNKLCQYGNMLRSSDKLHVYLVLMILVFGYYETIILKTRNLWSEYKCIWPKNISSIRYNIQEKRYLISIWRYNPMSYAFIFYYMLHVFSDNCFVITKNDFSCIHTRFIFLSFAFIFRP